MKTCLVLACISALWVSTSVHAQTVEALEQQLAAQKQINELLKQRIRKLEAELLDAKDNAANLVASKPATEPEPAPEKETGDPEESRALERALVRRGLAILPPGRWELTPGFVWGHSGSDAQGSSSDDYIGTLDARFGLPWGTMIGTGLPYFIKADRATGDNSGFGDLYLRVWKQFLTQDRSTPSLVGSITYIAPTGEDADDRVPLGSYFHRLRLNLNGSKSIDPVVVYGDLFYTYSFSEPLDGIDFKPGDIFGLRGGTSLAITPEITGNLGLRVSFVNELERDGVELRGTEQTIGTLEMGMGVILNKQFFLSITGDIGITDDAPDFALGVSLPIRF